MIAEVYPIKRMPRRFGVFDYAVPEGMTVARGTFVRVPFRFGELTGVVARVKDVSDQARKLKPVSGILPVPAFNDRELASLEAIAFDTAQSVSALFHAILPRPTRLSARNVPVAPRAQPLTVTSREAPLVAALAAQLSERQGAFVCVGDLKRAAVILSTYLREHKDKPIIVVVPNVRDARLLAGRFAGHKPLIVTGEESAGERYRAWTTWRSQPKGLLIGTRAVSLWTHPALGAIFVLRSGHHNHKQEDRNPRFDARAAAALMAKRLEARCFHFDVSPRAEDLHAFGATNILELPTAVPTTYADMTIERAGAPASFLGHSAVLKIGEALAHRRRVICAYNRKGVSRRLQCEDCSHRFPCPQCGGVLAVYPTTVRCHRCQHAEPMPVTCPSCRGSRLKAKGFGNRAVAAAIQTVFPEATVGCIEKGTDAEGADQSDILVVTRHYIENLFDPFHPLDVGAVVELDGDLPLIESTFRATENALLNAHEWRGVANASRAEFVIQTDAVELFRAGVSDVRAAIAEDLTTRQAYGQPPWTRTMTVHLRGGTPQETEAAMRLAEEQLKAAVPTLSVPRTDDGLAFVVQPDQEEIILRTLATFDDDTIVDTRAQE